MLRCADNSLYTGITTNIQRRLKEHFEKSEKCAKYTYTHTAIKLEHLWQTDTRSAASQLEYRIKTLKKEQKEKLISGETSLQDIFGDALNTLEFVDIFIDFVENF